MKEIGEEENYEDIAQWRLVLYALAKLEEEKKETSIDDVAVRAYYMFPKKFSMLAYPDFPDQMRVGRELQRAYSFKMIVERSRKSTDKQKRAKSYKLTRKGIDEVEKIEEMFKIPLKHEIYDKRNKDNAMIMSIERNPLFKEYMKNGRVEIEDYEFKHLLMLPPYAEDKEVARVVENLKFICEKAGREDLKKFLMYCVEHIS